MVSLLTNQRDLKIKFILLFYSQLFFQYLTIKQEKSAQEAIPSDPKLLKSKEFKSNQLENKDDIKLEKYLLSKDSTAEEKAKVLPFIESIVSIDNNIERHLNKTNANNTNGITHEMQKMV